MDGIAVFHWLDALVAPAVFLLVLWLLAEPRLTRRTARVVGLVFLAAEVLAQGVVFALGGSPELVFTLFPLTLYLPAIVGVHLLSKNRFLPTALAWLLALLSAYLLLALQKLLMLSFTRSEAVLFAVLLPAAAALTAVVLLLLRAPFRAYAKDAEGPWAALLFLPAMLLALYSYFLASVTDVGALLLLFFTALASAVVIVRLLASLAESRRAGEARRQMEALRQDCALLEKKLALGRGYRHDMRHHMAALSALLQQGDREGAQRYVADLRGRLTQIETTAWCRSAAVNGVLSAYLAQAREAGCTAEVDVSLPGELPFEDIDLSIVLANALENAIHACEAAPEGAPRHIKLALSLADGRRLTVRVENSCYEQVEFGADGFPLSTRSGHGQGLRSIAAVTEKYHGLFQCDCRDGTFILRLVLLDGAQKPQKPRRAPAVCAGVFLCLFLLNCLPTVADALEAIPVLGQVIRVVDVRTYALGWGDTGVSVQDPALAGPGADALATRKDAFTQEMRETFLDYAARKYQGYVAEDVAYDVVRDDAALFTLRFSATLNAGGSVSCSRYVTLDKATGRVLALSDLFLPDVNYTFPISREIKAQMAEQMNAGTGDYFLPGGVWSDDECFQSIDPEQNFYVNDQGQLVIVFAEYEVAPGSMGEPAFTIPTDLLDGLLAEPSVLR